MNLQQVKPSELKGAKYNPVGRTSKKGINPLLQSVKQYGILYPLMIDGKNNIIDGHRRLACAVELKFKTVPCIVSESTLGADNIYETINRTSKKIGANEMMFIYYNGGVVPTKAKGMIEQIKNIIGERNFKEIVNKSISFRILEDAKRVSRYCGDMSGDFVKASLMWLIDNNQRWASKMAMLNGIQPVKLKEAVLNDRKLKQTFV